MPGSNEIEPEFQEDVPEQTPDPEVLSFAQVTSANPASAAAIPAKVTEFVAVVYVGFVVGDWISTVIGATGGGRFTTPPVKPFTTEIPGYPPKWRTLLCALQPFAPNNEKSHDAKAPVYWQVAGSLYFQLQSGLKKTPGNGLLVGENKDSWNLAQ